MPFDLTRRPLLPPPRPPYRWWLPLPYLVLLTFTLRWSTLAEGWPGVLGAVAVALGGWTLGLCSFRASGTPYKAWLGGILYCFVSSLLEPFGRHAPRELLANCCVIGAWLVSVAPREYGVFSKKQERLTKRRGEWSAAGLLLGLATLLHPLAVAILPAVAAHARHHYQRRTPGEGRQATGYLLAAAAGTVVVLGAALSLPATDRVHFGNWGQQALLLGRYLLLALPLLLLGLLSLFGNILSTSTSDFGTLLRYCWQLLPLAILLFGGGRPEALVLFHPVLTLLVTEWMTAKSIPPYDAKHGMTLLWVLAVGTAVGYYHA